MAESSVGSLRSLLILELIFGIFYLVSSTYHRILKFVRIIWVGFAFFISNDTNGDFLQCGRNGCNIVKIHQTPTGGDTRNTLKQIKISCQGFNESFKIIFKMVKDIFTFFETNIFIRNAERR